MSWRNRSPKTLAHIWPLNGHYADLIRGQDGTPVNSPTWAQTPWGPQCIELDGSDQAVNLGDVAALNSVSAFSLCFWMNQDALDQNDMLFRKQGVSTSYRVTLQPAADGEFYVIIANGASTFGRFDYSTVISARSWHHIAVVFDGSQTGDANRLQVYVDGIPVTLTFAGPIPATTADLSGVDATISWDSIPAAFDGKLFEFQLHSVPLSRDEVNDVMRGHG